jgi:uncharacterized protein (DUF2267 family)
VTLATHIAGLDSGIDKTNRWLKEMSAALGESDRHEAYRQLRSVLHALRDRLPVTESAQLAAQLPLLLRGVYYEGWRPSETPTNWGAREFLDRVAAEANLGGETEASYAVEAAAGVLRGHISAG